MAITQVGSAGTTVVSGTSVAATCPAGVVDGDLLLCSVANVVASASITAPSGWTQIDSGAAGTTLKAALFYRWASGETAGTTTYTWTTAGARSEAIITAWRGVQPAASGGPIDNSGAAHGVASSNTAATTIPYPSVTTSSSGAVVVGFGWGRNATAGLTNSAWTQPTSWSELADITSTTASANELTGEAVTITPSSAGATGTANATLNNSSTYVTFAVALQPTGGSGTGGVAFRAASSAALASASTQSLTLPAGIQGGDFILVFADIGVTSSVPTYTAPAGYSELVPGGVIDTNGASGTLSLAFWKIAAGSLGSASSDAGATVSVAMNSAHGAAMIAVVYSGVSNSSPIHASAHAQESTPGVGVTSLAAPSLSTTVPSWVIEKTGGKGGTTANTSYSTPTGTTKRADVYGTGSGSMSAIVVGSNALIPDGTVGGHTFTSSQNEAYAVGWTIALLPATSTPGTPPGAPTGLTGSATAPSTLGGTDGTIDLSWIKSSGSGDITTLRTGAFAGCFATYYPGENHGQYDASSDGRHVHDSVVTMEAKTGATFSGPHQYRDSSSVTNFLKLDDLVMLNGGKLSTGTTVPPHPLEYLTWETCIYGGLPAGMPTPAGSTKDYGGKGTNDVYTYQQIYQGVLDDFITGVAKRIKSYGKPVRISFDSEVDNCHDENGGNNYKRSAAFRFQKSPLKGQNFGDYGKALAHIQGIFAAQGVTNVIWCQTWSGWRGTGDPMYQKIWTLKADGVTPLVDWVGFDPYKHSGTTAGSADQLLNYKPDSSPGWYDALMANFLTGSASLPFFLGEYGCKYFTDDSRASTFFPSIVGLLSTTRTKYKAIDYYASGAWGDLHRTWSNCALSAAGNTVTKTSHGLVAGAPVWLSNLSAGTGLTANDTSKTPYYVVNPTTNTFQLATTSSGSAVGISANGTADVTTWDDPAITAFGTMLANSYMQPSFGSGVPAATYRVYDSTGALVATVAAPTVNAHLTGYAAGDYEFTVTAMAADGVSESPPSDPVTVTVPAVAAAFPAPTNLRAAGTDSSNAQFVVDWDAVPGAPGYVIKRSDDGGGTWAVRGGVKLIPELITSTLVSGSGYLYQAFVAAADGTIISAGSNVLAVTSGSPPPPATTAIAGASVGGDAMVGWPAAVGASYDVQRAPDSAGSPGTFASLASGLGDNFYADTTVAVGSSYWYRYRTNIGSTTGSWSAPVQVTVTAATPLTAALNVAPSDGSADPGQSVTVVLGNSIRFADAGTSSALQEQVVTDVSSDSADTVTIDPFVGYVDYVPPALGVFTAQLTASTGTSSATDSVTYSVIPAVPVGTSSPTPRPIWLIPAALAYAPGDMIDNDLYEALQLDQSSAVTTVQSVNGVQYAVGPGPAGPTVATSTTPQSPGGA